MRNLIAFIWRNNSFFLFLILEVLCAFLIVQNNNFHNATFINSANDVAGNIYGTVNNITKYFHLKEENEKLAHENAILHSISRESFTRIKGADSLVNDTIFRRKYIYQSAKVVNNSVNKRNNYITLDKGRNQGIEPETAVISSGGVVGIVKDVSDNFSSVLSVLHKDSKISARLRGSNYFGSLIWEGGDYKFATLKDIPTHVQLHKGDTIETNAFSSIFPEGVLIGFVESFEIKPGHNFYTIKIRLSTNFKNVTHVYVVKNLMKEEQRQLEENTQHD